MNIDWTLISKYGFPALSLILFLAIWRQHLGLSSTAKRSVADAALIEQAIAQTGDDLPKHTYLRSVVHEELIYLVDSYSKANMFRLLFGSIYLLTGFASIGITGTDATIPGYLDTTRFSFWVNIIGEVASGFLIFGGFEATNALDKKLAKELRLELAQFIGESSEYFGQTELQRWNLFTTSVEGLLLSSFDTVKSKIESTSQS